MRRPKQFYVYIMTNRPRSHVLYPGITGDLSRRVFEHKNKLVPGFTSRYNLTRLADYASFFYPDAAIKPAKTSKQRRWGEKNRVVESTNPHWNDLAERWSEVYKPTVPGAAREIPRPAGENAGLRDDASQQR